MSKFFTEADCDVSHGKKLDPQTGQNIAIGDSITVGKANRLLRERGRVVYGEVNVNGYGSFCDEICGSHDTHTALLINIQPMERDSAESLLREFIACCEVNDPKLRWGELKMRAKRLLGGEK